MKKEAIILYAVCGWQKSKFNFNCAIINTKKRAGKLNCPLKFCDPFNFAFVSNHGDTLAKFLNLSTSIVQNCGEMFFAIQILALTTKDFFIPKRRLTFYLVALALGAFNLIFEVNVNCHTRILAKIPQLSTNSFKSIQTIVKMNVINRHTDIVNSVPSLLQTQTRINHTNKFNE